MGFPVFKHSGLIIIHCAISLRWKPTYHILRKAFPDFPNSSNTSSLIFPRPSTSYSIIVSFSSLRLSLAEIVFYINLFMSLLFVWLEYKLLKSRNNFCPVHGYIVSAYGSAWNMAGELIKIIYWMKQWLHSDALHVHSISLSTKKYANWKDKIKQKQQSCSRIILLSKISTKKSKEVWVHDTTHSLRKAKHKPLVDSHPCFNQEWAAEEDTKA